MASARLTLLDCSGAAGGLCRLRRVACWSWLSCLLVVLLLVFASGCPDSDDSRGSASTSQDAESEIDRLRSLPYAGGADGTEEDERAGVIVHDRERSCPGYSLYGIQQTSRADLIDEEGRVVRSWSYSPSWIWTACELLPNGDLLAIGAEPAGWGGRQYTDEDRYIVRFNWDGQPLWKRKITAHHDVELTPRGQLLTLTLQRVRRPKIDPDIDIRDDFLTLLDQDGQVLSSVCLFEAFARKFGSFKLQRIAPETFGDDQWIDLFHTNSVEWMHWPHLAGRHAIYDDPANVLICSRHQDVIAVVNYDRRELVWAWGRGELSGAHDAQVLENGNILIFDNGIDPQRQWSRVIEVDPVREGIVWEYKAPNPADFFSLTKGSCQRLPNGNTLIACSDQGRAFEVTAGGDVVWEFLCPYRTPEGKRATMIRMRRFDRSYIDAIEKQHGK